MDTSNLLDAFIYLVIFGVIVFVLFWGLREIGLPEPWNKVIKAILVLFVVIGLVDFLLGFTGHSFLHLR